jgi:aspartate-semialdehyde dehydrogenase
MSQYNVAIVGATGLVGETLISLLEDREFPVSSLIPLASERSQNKHVQFKGQNIKIQVLNDFNFTGVDFAFFSAGALVSEQFVPTAAKAGAIVIDNTSQFRYQDHIPLVIPEVNPDALINFSSTNIIANPNCSTIQMLVALNPIHQEASIKKINVATYQAISGAGRKTLDIFNQQLISDEYPNSDDPMLFAHNVIPQVGEFDEDGNSIEEMKMLWETQKIFNDQEIRVNATAVRVPVRYGHSEAVSIQTEKPIAVNEINRLLQSSAGIKVLPDNESYPLPIIHGEGTDDVFVGRIRKDLTTENGINLWIVADNIRKGAALNSIQIAELLIKSYI